MTIISSSSNLLHNRAGGRPVWLILALITVMSVGGYLLVSAIMHHIGFPLDDAWIHQTYARNLALRGEWAFIPGKPSDGSTAPLWSALLAIGFYLKLAPYVWTYLLGAMTLWILSLLGENAVRGLVPAYRPRFPWVGAVLALEWHLVWAAASGMETLLYALLATAALVFVISGSKKYSRLGLLIGLSVWVRPDGITLLGPAVLIILLCQPSWPKRLWALVNLGVGFGSPFTIYLLFNLLISGQPWPNTFYAKQAEYAMLLKSPFVERWGGEALPLLTGVGVVLLPGVVLAIASAVHRRAWGKLAAVIWLIGYLAVYAWLLPVTYQYGRYVMPAMPIYFVLGLAGLIEFVLGRWASWRWMIRESWKLLTGIILISFWVLGAYSYAKDVTYIDDEMVTTAHWVAENVPSGTLIAAHDIGAMGYFGRHDLVDLAGLITPKVIPFIRDESKLSSYLDERGVNYLVVFPDWYPMLTEGLHPIFVTSTIYPPNSGGSNMAVYRWPAP